MNVKHCRHTIRSLLWKLWHETSQSGNERLSFSGLDSYLRGGTIAATEAERSAQCGSEFGQHFVDRVTNRGGAAARVVSR